ncbi:MAG: RAMP superfamily CRISPR-associated protein, partial [Anaerolineae bacterium]|nr:RAMP superfamily CRISPR-associated protein [Anaerolineae bacterium]
MSLPKHSNPTQLRYDEKDNVYVQAHAPYNFVPLPEKMVPAQPLPDYGIYHPELLTGWIDCTLETCSPTYIRGMMTEQQYKEFGEKGSDELTPEQKDARAPFYSTSEDKKPVIPGSSLRGMIRT